MTTMVIIRYDMWSGGKTGEDCRTVRSSSVRLGKHSRWTPAANMSCGQRRLLDLLRIVHALTILLPVGILMPAQVRGSVLNT